MKFRAPLLYSVCTQFTAHDTVSTSVTPPACFPVSSPSGPTSFVPIQRVYIVSSCLIPTREPLLFAAKYFGSWDSTTGGAPWGMSLLEHIAPALAKEKSLKFPSWDAKTGQVVPPSAWAFCEVGTQLGLVSLSAPL